MKKKPLTVTEFARMGGKARAEKLSPERRKQIASEAGKKGGRPRKPHLTTRHNQRRTHIWG